MPPVAKVWSVLSGPTCKSRTGKICLDRTQAVQDLQQLQIQDYSLGDLVTEMNRDAFVVSYTITLHATTKGQALSAQPQRRVTVWQQQKSGWVAIAHSVMGPG
ncbi:MAG: hypothetical protein DMG81_03450 [Acidobacteria bacterium]|nr:MAG: hypothetical protein DMG81_03450 [Acidobacteriota bacterium]